jgi:hypothetical protein
VVSPSYEDSPHLGPLWPEGLQALGSDGRDARHHTILGKQKKQWDARFARLTAGKSVAMLPCYAGKESSTVSPSMSAATA